MESSFFDLGQSYFMSNLRSLESQEPCSVLENFGSDQKNSETQFGKIVQFMKTWTTNRSSGRRSKSLNLENHAVLSKHILIWKILFIGPHETKGESDKNHPSRSQTINHCCLQFPPLTIQSNEAKSHLHE